MTYRTACRVCGSQRLDAFLELPDMPLTDAFLPEDRLGQEFRCAVKIFRCTDCGVCQTLHDVDMGDYYNEYTYTTSASGFARRFMQELAEEAWRRFGLRSGDVVVEVGSGDGAQLGFFKQLGAKVFGFEPSAPLVAAARTAGIPVALRLFDHEAERDIPPDCLPVHLMLLCYTFDHLPDPMDFLAGARRVLDPQRGVLLLEVHDLAKIVERREFCLFEHEHTTYCCAATMQELLRRAGFEVLDVGLLPEERRRANSLVVSATPRGSARASGALPTLEAGELGRPETYAAFGQAILSSMEKLRTYVRDQRARGRRLAGYGAGGRGVMTLAACARPGDFAYVCDQNPSFHGLYTPGAHVPVVPPQHALQDPVDEMVVFSFGYLDEISRSLAGFRERGGKLVSLLELL